MNQGYGQFQSASGAAALSASPVCQPQVSEWLDKISAVLDDFEKSRESMRLRLQAVSTASQVGENKAGQSAPEVNLVPLASALRTIYKRLSSANTDLIQMTSAVEL